MQIVSWNVNGIRSVYRQNFLEWFLETKADIVCLQEIKCHPDVVTDKTILHPGKYHSFWCPAEKPGYSGLLVYSKRAPLSVTYGVGKPEYDREGRVMTVEYKDFLVVNTYFPNSQRDHARLPYKLKFCRDILKYLEGLRAKGKNILICGDFNIAHKEIDLRNPKSNKDNAGFLPEERAWMDQFIETGYVDTFRQFEQGPDHYTWWSYRPGVRERNVGWRLDYFFANEEFADRTKNVTHLPHVRGSDHCPVLLRLKK